MSKKLKLKTLFISDLHLGTKSCKAAELDDFLKNIEVKEIYLLGDILDISAIRRKLYWDKYHNAILKRFFKMAQNGIKITYIPGNHDTDIREFAEMNFSGILVSNEIIFTSADKKRYFLIHGDKFDGILNEKMWFLYSLGDHCYEFAIMLNRPVRAITKIFGSNDWSLSGYLKSKVKNVIKFIANFEHLVASEAKLHRCDGVICGHIHTANDRMFEGIRYLNCGCWTEDGSAIGEMENGEMKMIRFNTDE